ncbi:hypothetical protein HFD88_007821 [Aspergillus terreus]|nr:hypothetical protein HFD88_007821 [Aspergillus terreus]
MAIPPSSFGSLGKLPAELRLSIWADVISSRQPAVLRASRAIYEEIVHELNHVLEYTLFPDYKRPWLSLHSPRTGLTFDITRRDGKKIRKRLWQLPYNNTVLTIHLMAPNPKNPGEIALLWQKAHDLVGILNRANTPTGSIPHPGDPRPDYLVAFLPFCRLNRRVPIRWRFVKYGCDFIMNDGYKTYNDSDYSRKPKYRRITRSFDNVDRMLAETDFFLETALDLLPGHTAAMLRLDRFARWFTTSDPDDSPYQRQCLLTLREYSHVVDIYDPQLSRLTERHRAFEAFYFTVSRSKNAVAVRCNRKDWYTTYPDGIDILTRERINSEESRVLSRKRWGEPPGDQMEQGDASLGSPSQTCEVQPVQDVRPRSHSAAVDIPDPDGSTYAVSDPVPLDPLNDDFRGLMTAERLAPVSQPVLPVPCPSGAPHSVITRNKVSQKYNMGGPDLENGQAFEKKSPDHIRMPPLSDQTSRAQSEASQSENSLKDRAETERENGDAACTRFCSCDTLRCIGCCELRETQREMAALHAKDVDAGRRAAEEARRMVRNQRAKVNRVDEAHKGKRE